MSAFGATQAKRTNQRHQPSLKPYIAERATYMLSLSPVYCSCQHGYYQQEEKGDHHEPAFEGRLPMFLQNTISASAL